MDCSNSYKPVKQSVARVVTVCSAADINVDLFEISTRVMLHDVWIPSQPHLDPSDTKAGLLLTIHLVVRFHICISAAAEKHRLVNSLAQWTVASTLQEYFACGGFIGALDLFGASRGMACACLL